MIVAVVAAALGVGQAKGWAEFPPAARQAALAASVRVVNVGKWEGSGAVVGRRDGFVYVLTARHVAKDIEKLTVAPFDGPARPAERATAEFEADLALVRVKDDGGFAGRLRVAAPGREPPPSRFPALAVGAAAGQPPSARVEAIVGKKLVRRAPPVGGTAFYWQAGREPEGGRSGGPLVDASGQLIGICSAGQDGRGYYTHAREIQAFLKGQGFAWIYEEK
jgi:S1-C subfamily serine protease